MRIRKITSPLKRVQRLLKSQRTRKKLREEQGQKQARKGPKEQGKGKNVDTYA